MPIGKAILIPPLPSQGYFTMSGDIVSWHNCRIECYQHQVAEKATAPHSSPLAWKIPWTEEPGRLQSMLSQTRLNDFTFTFHFHALEKEMATHSRVLAWRSPGRGSMVGCRLWGRTESDTTEATWQQHNLKLNMFNITHQQKQPT